MKAYVIINTSSSVTVNVVVYITSHNEDIRDNKHVVRSHSECGSVHDLS